MSSSTTSLLSGRAGAQTRCSSPGSVEGTAVNLPPSTPDTPGPHSHRPGRPHFAESEAERLRWRRGPRTHSGEIAGGVPALGRALQPRPHHKRKPEGTWVPSPVRVGQQGDHPTTPKLPLCLQTGWSSSPVRNGGAEEAVGAPDFQGPQPLSDPRCRRASEDTGRLAPSGGKVGGPPGQACAASSPSPSRTRSPSFGLLSLHRVMGKMNGLTQIQR